MQRSSKRAFLALEQLFRTVRSIVIRNEWLSRLCVVYFTVLPVSRLYIAFNCGIIDE
jgi:hypothetical protein